jgi:hypothetical protein
MFHSKKISRIGKRAHAAPMMFARGVTAALLFCAQARAQQGPAGWEVAEIDRATKKAACDLYGWCGGNGGGGSAPRIGVDPCFLAQNAMRPCTSNTGQTKPMGVDPNLAGTWELPFRGGAWILTIERNGTYKFHSEAGDSVPANAGSFSASDGHWSLKADKMGYSDAGDYLYQAPNVFIATGQRGAVAWLRPDLAKEAMRRCAPGKQPASKPANGKPNVDPHLVGTWELPLKTGGSWVWEISSNGTYKFHSDAMDKAPSHNGEFSAGNGQWSLTATSGIQGYTDTGNYLYQAPNVLMANGHLGGAAWLRSASSLCTP